MRFDSSWVRHCLKDLHATFQKRFCAVVHAIVQDFFTTLSGQGFLDDTTYSRSALSCARSRLEARRLLTTSRALVLGKSRSTSRRSATRPIHIRPATPCRTHKTGTDAPLRWFSLWMSQVHNLSLRCVPTPTLTAFCLPFPVMASSHRDGTVLRGGNLFPCRTRFPHDISLLSLLGHVGRKAVFHKLTIFLSSASQRCQAGSPCAGSQDNAAPPVQFAGRAP